MEFSFVGTVAFVGGESPDHPWGHIELGDDAVFRYIIDVEQPDQVSNPAFGRYDLAAASIGFGGIETSSQETRDMFVDTALPNGSQSLTLIQFGIFSDSDQVSMNMTGTSAIFSDEIPIEMRIDSFNISRNFTYSDGTGFGISAAIDSYSYQVIPGPPMIGAFCLFALTSRRRRNV